MERLAEVMKKRAKTIGKGKDLVCETTRVLQETCDTVLKKRTKMGKRKGVYWWMDKIANKRKELAIEKGIKYKHKKKELKIMIQTSKEKAWKSVR